MEYMRRHTKRAYENTEEKEEKDNRGSAKKGASINYRKAIWFNSSITDEGSNSYIEDNISSFVSKTHNVKM